MNQWHEIACIPQHLQTHFQQDSHHYMESEEKWEVLIFYDNRNCQITIYHRKPGWQTIDSSRDEIDQILKEFKVLNKRLNIKSCVRHLQWHQIGNTAQCPPPPFWFFSCWRDSEAGRVIYVSLSAGHRFAFLRYWRKCNQPACLTSAKQRWQCF